MRMRTILPFCALVLLSTGAQAQQAQQLAEPAAATQQQAVEAKLAPTSAVMNVQNGPTEVKPIQTTERRATAEATEVVADEAVRQTTIPRGFWWLVGAVVIGGLILVLIL